MARIDKAELCVALALVGLGSYVAFGAVGLTAHTGYAGVGPRFFPALVAAGLIGVGACLAVQGARGGWPNRERAAGRLRAPPLLFVAAGAGLHTALIGAIGFVAASTLLFALVARAFGSGRWLRNGAVGLLLAGLAYAFFTQVVSVNLPVGSLFETPAK